MFSVDNLEFRFEREEIISSSGYFGEYEDTYIKTYCIVSRIDGDKRIEIARGETTCLPEDAFVKAIGRKKALKYAILDLRENHNFDRIARGKIWDAYFKMSPRSKQ